MTLKDIAQFIKQNIPNHQLPMVIVSVIGIIFLFYATFKAREAFTAWDPNFNCNLTNVSDFVSKSPDGEEIRTSYGESPIGDFYVDTPFAATGYTQNAI